MVIANFYGQKDTYKTVSGLWQWDYGQTMRIQGLNLPSAVEIHFSLQQSGGEAVTRIGITKDGVTDVTIPDSMLENDCKSVDYYIYAFVYISDGDSGQTEYRITLPVKSRPKPEAWSGSGETTMGQIMEAVNQIASGKADGLEYKDGILRLLSGDQELDQVEIAGESSGTISDTQIQTAVNNYLESNPVQPGATEEQAAQIAKNAGDISQLSEEIADSIKTKSTAEVGQTIVVKTVDETGKPTEFEMESVADEMDALVSLSECGILIPVYQNGTFYTDGNGFIYTL